LGKTSEAWPLIQQAHPDAHCLVVAGPRLDPNSLLSHDGLEIRAYVHNLYEYLAVADLGIVQGGLSTTMELTLNRRPFLYFPLKNHCEQVYHVAHRLDHYRAGRRLHYADISVASLASAAVEMFGADTSNYRPFTSGAAGRAASLVAELL
jgi:UDP-N-acetylglucosamine:LPS N-acetylglucosamine transferase